MPEATRIGVHMRRLVDHLQRREPDSRPSRRSRPEDAPRRVACLSSRTVGKPDTRSAQDRGNPS